MIIDDAEERSTNISHEDHKEGCKLVEKPVEQEESLDCPAGGFENPETFLTYSSRVEEIRPISNLISGSHNQYFTTDWTISRAFRQCWWWWGSSYACLISNIPASGATEAETDQHVFQKTVPSNIYLSNPQDFQCQDDTSGTSLYDMPWLFDDNANCTFTNYNKFSLDQQSCFKGFPNTSLCGRAMYRNISSPWRAARTTVIPVWLNLNSTSLVS